MTVGTGIFLSAVFLGIVVLLISTKDKWTWKALFLYPAIASFVLGLVIAAVAYLQDRNRDKDLASVRVTVSYDSKSLDPDYPIHIFIVNNGTKTVTEINGYLSAREAGHSGNLITYDFDPYELKSDRILEPKSSCDLYYRLPTPRTYSQKPLKAPEKLEWGVENIRPIFR